MLHNIEKILLLILLHFPPRVSLANVLNELRIFLTKLEISLVLVDYMDLSISSGFEWIY